MNPIRSFLIKHVILFVILFFSVRVYAQTINYDIRLNQIGYYPNLDKKVAAAAVSGTAFSVQSLDHASTFFTGIVDASGIADFSSFTTPGNYVLYVPGVGYSAPFKIHTEVFKDLSVAALKGYYYKRASTAITPANGGVYSRAAGHPDTQVMIHSSAASTGRPAGTIVSSPKGWYDAGDYNCYVVNSNISTYTLLAAYEHFSSYYDTLNLNIPESGNGMPDILNEIKWNLDWMLTMQDPYDGRVYDKKTTAAFSEFIMPEADQAQRYLVGKSAGATYGFAAVMAVAYRVYLPYDAAYANQCLAVSKKAYASGANGSSYNPPDISTGVYNSQSNEGVWAGIELYISTKNDMYYVPNYQNFCQYVPKWYQVNTVGLMSLVHHRKNLTAIGFSDTTTIKNSLLAFANPARSNTAFKAVFAGEWGDNSFALNAGMMDMCAYMMTKDQRYLNSAIYILDFVLGKNGSGYCYVTSFGSKKVMHPHDRISSADGIVDPIPGWVVGGGGYVDVEERYDVNEVAINWNAPLVFLTGAVQYANRNDIHANIEVSNGTTSLSSDNTYAVSLGAAPVNESADALSITIKNSGMVVLTITSITGTSGFSVDATNAVGSLAPGSTAVFTIQATPGQAGLNAGTIKIVSNDLVHPVFTLNVSVKGTVAGQSLIEVLNGADELSSDNDPVLLLGSANINAPVVPVTITLRNVGDAPLEINSITATTGFEVSALSPVGSIAVGSSATFTITATPKNVGTNAGTITIATNDPANQIFLLNVSAIGIGPLLKIYQNGILYNDGAEYVFSSSTTIGTQDAVAFTIKNEGTAVLTLDPILFTEPFEGIGYIPASLNINQEASFTLVFKPVMPGLNQGTLSFSGNADKVTVLNLSGTGVLATGTLGKLAADAINVSPNPTKQDAAIQMNGTFSNVSFNVYNTLGELVVATALGDAANTSVPLVLTNMASGMYIVEVITDQGISMKRVIKE